MIDTVSLGITRQDIPTFLPRFQKKQQSADVVLQVYSPDNRSLKVDGYAPYFCIRREYDELQKRWHVRSTTLVASLPKLLYGTNYYGVDENDYKEVIERLTNASQKVGLPFEEEDIEEATLKRVDFCFNFFLPKHCPYPQEFLKKMQSFDAGKVFGDTKHTTYMETTEGFSLQFYNGQVGVSMYDKRAELINQGKTPEEKELIWFMKNNVRPDKVLRFEVRWQKRKAVEQHLEKYYKKGIFKETRHLQDVFHNDIARDVLTRMFAKVTNPIDTLLLEIPLTPIEDIYKVCREAKMSQFQTEALIGRAIAMQTLGKNKYEEMQDRYFPRQARYTTKKQYERLVDEHVLPYFSLDFILTECKLLLEKFEVRKPYDEPYQTKENPLQLFA